MASETTNYKLKKPSEDDFYDVQDFNGNMELIDGALKGNADRVARVEGIRRIALSASGWSPSAPFTQVVSVPGVTAADAPVIGMSIAEGTTAVDVKLQNKAWACVDRAVTGAGTITFYCYNKKPTVDFAANVKGVG
ncbi:MAG: hypothetical protein PHV18_05035 [Lachnospiraceae bacterium]|nr:hypothetical protein [Lachnospiraceae bacterium]